MWTRLLACTLLLTACAQYVKNEKLDHFDKVAGYRFRPGDDPEGSRLLVLLTFSGGGTRAAAFSYGVLEALRDVTLPNDSTRTLLDEVDLISSVSGGSFTAAYYGLHGKEIFDDYKGRVLYRDIQGDLFWKVANPLNLVRLASPAFDRIDLAGEYYDAELFDRKSFADLRANARRPFIVLNATDMAVGARFEFTQDQFDLIGSDLDRFPIGRAVAASSAFPVLLSPVRLVNHPAPAGYEVPDWIGNGLEDVDLNPTRYERARTASSYLETGGEDGSRRRRYLHLLDGGISDNIGLRGPMVALTSNDSPSSILNAFNNEEVDRVVVIAVDAKTKPEHDWDRNESSPSTIDVLMTVCTTPMDNYSTDTLRLVESQFEEQAQEQRARASVEKMIRKKIGDPDFKLDPLHSVDFNFVNLTFDRVKDPKRRRTLLEMSTNFHLSHEEVELVIGSAKELLAESQSFQRLLRELKKSREEAQ